MTEKLLPKNIKYLRKQNNVNQTQLGLQVNKTHKTVSNWETGFNEPNYLEIIEIGKYFGISIDNLLTKDLSNTKILEKTEVTEKEDNTKKSTKIYTKISPLSVVSEPIEVYGQPMAQNGFNVFDLDSKAAAGMAVLLQDNDKFNQLPSLSMPYLGAGLHIRLKITGDSMHNTIKDGDKVVATHCPEPSQALREGNIYVIFDKEEGVVCKRIYKVDKNNWEFVSDNEVYKPYKRHLNDIQAIFRVVEVHTTDLRNYNSDTRKEIALLWKEVEVIKQKVKL